jgi:hypothetical protein
MANFVFKKSNNEVVFINGDESFVNLGDGTFTLSNAQPEWEITPWDETVFEGVSAEIEIPQDLVLGSATLTQVNGEWVLSV